MFRMEVDDQTAAEIAASQGADPAKFRAEIEEALRKYENVVLSDIQDMQGELAEAIRLEIVTGNVLLYLSDDGPARVLRLDKYVVRRDPAGRVVEIIIQETVDKTTLPQNVQEIIDLKNQASGASDDDLKKREVEVYTCVKLEDDGMYEVYQEVKGEKIEATYGKYPAEDLPFIALRFHRVDGENYGRGHVEEQMGDLLALEDLMKALRQGSLAAAKVLWRINTASSLTADELANTPNGGFVEADEGEVGVLHMDKHGDFSTASNMVQEITQRLSFAFLLNSSVQRKGERVTAEEIRFMAGELQDALGGFYAVQSKEFQLRVVKAKIAQLEKKGKLPTLPGDIKPKIITGLDALGRSHDGQRLDNVMARAGQLLGPETLAQLIEPIEYLKRLFTAEGVEAKGLVKDEQKMALEQQNQQLMALIQQVAPEALKQLGGMAQTQMQQQEPNAS